MRKLNIYTFHRNIKPFRFDNHNTDCILKTLQKIHVLNCNARNISS